MKLRPGTYYKSRNHSKSDSTSKASTLGSTTRTPSLSNQFIEQLNKETLLESNMDTNFSPVTILVFSQVWMAGITRHYLYVRDYIICSVVLSTPLSIQLGYKSSVQ